MPQASARRGSAATSARKARQQEERIATIVVGTALAHNRGMRACLIALVAIGCGGARLPSIEDRAKAVTLPALELKLRGGGTWVSGEAIGKVLVLDVWATYCKPCKRAFPKLGKLAAAFPDVVVIGISVDEEDAVVEKYLAETPAGFTIARDAERRVQSGALAVEQLPTLIVVDKQGKVRLRADLAREEIYDQLPEIVEKLRAE
jgi:cytochrome c biogenesis protein CcmG, thiol:disulfide interchange protein DsbE